MSYIQGGQNSDDAGANNITVTLTGVTNGNYLAAYSTHESDSGSITFSTSSGSTSAWTQTVDQAEAGDFAIIGAAYASATATGNVTIQASAEGVNTYIGLIVLEIDNINAYDASQYDRETGNPAVSTAATPSGYDAMLCGFCYDWGSSGVPTASSGWTERVNGMDYPDQAGTVLGVSETRLYTSGTAQASFATSGLGPFFTVHLIFTENAAGGANPKGPLGMPFHGPFAGPIGP